ncbi:MAG: hypothetical protein HKN11_16730 [Rhizobiales bacterium]|nr:hypothetical protein [Hyphomicrobiales bacterium]
MIMPIKYNNVPVAEIALPTQVQAAAPKMLLILSMFSLWAATYHNNGLSNIIPFSLVSARGAALV